jgi:toxin-antitoxin system PIN domain toxin
MSGPYLLDVNVLIALIWPAHEMHMIAQQWMGPKARHGWATCPFTEAGFVRIISNPAFSPNGLTPEQAAFVLTSNLKDAHHRFWPDAIGFVEAVALVNAKILGHRQITDAYLLGLAIHNGGRLATFDKSIITLLPAGSPHARSVDLIGAP